MDPITSAEEMIIRFLTIYCPSRVKPKGKFVKQTSGNKTRGRKVPGICTNNRNIDTRMSGLMHIVMPMITSQIPKMGTKVLGFSNQ